MDPTFLCAGCLKKDKRGGDDGEEMAHRGGAPPFLELDLPLDCATVVTAHRIPS